jgi:aspartyl-tRNA(Asn)/glutamyl-tRNA(Gln) amidotransferase subunit C
MPAEREDFPVARVAALARLELSPAEADHYRAQLARIVEFVAQVAADGTGTPEDRASGDAAPARERPDATRASLAADAALANAPDAARSSGLVRVPKVLG